MEFGSYTAIMYYLVLILILSLSACSHELQKDPAPDVSDNDNSDAFLDKNITDQKVGSKDRQMVSFGDFSSPTGCSTSLPSTAPTNLSGDCKLVTSWTCNTQCKGFDRLTCFKGTVFQREIRCDSTGLCECKVGSNGTPTRCTGVPVQENRSGCGRCKEVLVWGCCKPK